MRQLEYLYPVSVALDITAVLATSAFPILALVSFIRSGWRQGRVTTAYLGYVCCALLVMSFTLLFGDDDPGRVTTIILAG
jgi:hypothetical protein